MNLSPLQSQFCPWDGYQFLPEDNICSLCQQPRLNQSSHSPWQKILYDHNQSSLYPDNYVHQSSFLKSIKTDTSSTSNNLDLANLIHLSSEVAVTPMNVVSFLILFDILLSKAVLVVPVFSVLFLLILIAGQLYILIIPKLPTAYQILQVAKSILILLGTLMILSPVVRDSYVNYADDTVHQLTCILILFYLFFNDYQYQMTPVISQYSISKAVLSTQFFSMLLASRLDSNNKVILLFVASYVLFIFSHFFSYALKQYSYVFYQYFLLSYALAIALFLHSYYSCLYAVVYVLGLVFIVLICPIWITYLYQYKNTVKGPWDLPPNVNNYKLE